MVRVGESNGYRNIYLYSFTLFYISFVNFPLSITIAYVLAQPQRLANSTERADHYVDEACLVHVLSNLNTIYNLTANHTQNMKNPTIFVKLST